MEKINTRVIVLYFLLIMVCSIVWLKYADPANFPKFMFAYIFPYSYAGKALGKASYLPLFGTQFLAITSLLRSVLIRKGNKLVMDVFAGVLAIFWFVGVSLVLLIAHFH